MSPSRSPAVFIDSAFITPGLRHLVTIPPIEGRRKTQR
jgi:hypothetical protein